MLILVHEGKKHNYVCCLWKFSCRSLSFLAHHRRGKCWEHVDPISSYLVHFIVEGNGAKILIMNIFNLFWDSPWKETCLLYILMIYDKFSQVFIVTLQMPTELNIVVLDEDVSSACSSNTSSLLSGICLHTYFEGVFKTESRILFCCSKCQDRLLRMLPYTSVFCERKRNIENCVLFLQYFSVSYSVCSCFTLDCSHSIYITFIVLVISLCCILWMLQHGQSWMSFIRNCTTAYLGVKNSKRIVCISWMWDEL